LIFKPTLFLSNGKPKGNIDAELVLHTMLEYSNYDKAVIVSGDGDFHCLIEHLNKENKLLKIVIPNRHGFSSLLRNFVPQMLFMNGLKDKLEYKKR
ncbi:MAG: NYN domain-containing protein, partial [Candidatus Pacebacteria bacterium]|nr:NYN domain-containing protein [Candidatus Paceibacterota bacterium]